MGLVMTGGFKQVEKFSIQELDVILLKLKTNYMVGLWTVGLGSLLLVCIGGRHTL